MLLNLQIHKYDQDIYPYIKNGIIIDTSVFKTIVDGLVETRFSKKESPEFKKVLLFLDKLKMNNKWSKFFITPHVLTEVCNHIRNDYDDWKNFKEIINVIIPILKELNDRAVTKNEIIQFIDLKKPVVEIGDISIFVVADDFASKGTKIAILAIDRGFNKRYEHNKNVMVLDYRTNFLNQL